MSDPRLSRRGVMRGAVLLGVSATATGTGLWTASAAHAAVPAPTIRGTDAWGARPPSSPVSIHYYKPNKVIVHHTGTANSTDYSLSHAYALARSIQNYHMDHNGWIDTGQQLTISRGGHILEGRHRSLETLNGGTSFVHGAHAGAQNSESIGIENEGLYTSVAPTSALYNSLVDTIAYICDQYGIASSRIYGHRDFMATACPGNVLYGMLPQLRQDVEEKRNGGGGFSSIVDNTTSGRFSASGNWGTSSWSSQRYGSNYRFANPVSASDPAWYKVSIPTTRSYYVDAWYPANSGYNNAAPYVIVTTSGNQVVYVDQRGNGGKWVNLGSFSLGAGDYNVVGVSRWTSGSGYVIADAIRIRT